MNPVAERRPPVHGEPLDVPPHQQGQRNEGIAPLVATTAGTMIMSHSSASFGPGLIEVVIGATTASLAAGGYTLLEVPLFKPGPGQPSWPGALSMLVNNFLNPNVPNSPYVWCGILLPPLPQGPLAVGAAFPAGTGSIQTQAQNTSATQGPPSAGYSAAGQMAVRGVAINNSGLAQNGNIPGPQGSGFLQLNIILTVQNAGTLLAGSRIVLVPITGI